MSPLWTAAAIRLERAAIWRAVSSGNGAMPPSWWQPAHFCWTIGATSLVKLGGALSPREDASAASGMASARTTAAASPTRVPLRVLRVIGTPELAEGAADLADGGARAKRLAHRR